MKKYEPAITVVFLTLLFAVLAFLVARAVMWQPDLPVPRMECKSIEPTEPNDGYSGVGTVSIENDANFLLDEIHAEPNEPDDEVGEIVFEITDIPAPEALITFTGDGHNICLGEGAGLDLTDESYQFIVNVGGKMLQTTMTPEEYQTIYDVIDRAANEVNQ